MTTTDEGGGRMTTATRPRPATAKKLPEHGERACYLRGCRLPECSDAHYRYMKRYRLDRARTGTRRTDSGPVVQHVRNLIEQGWSQGQIAAFAQCGDRSINNLAKNPNRTIEVGLAARILAARPTVSAAPPKTWVDATGTSRRLRALVAIGYAINTIAQGAGLADAALGRIVNHNHQIVTARVALAIADLYKRWAGTPGTNARARNRAAREGWPPPAAWDDIDNPAAHPDWTGHCGTDRGWNIHRITRITECPPCQDAHRQWLADHAHLPSAERSRQAFAARTAANDRGITLAEDIRELMRFGCDREQAAARLGIKRDALNATLLRYPEPVAGADDGEEAA